MHTGSKTRDLKVATSDLADAVTFLDKILQPYACMQSCLQSASPHLHLQRGANLSTVLVVAEHKLVVAELKKQMCCAKCCCSRPASS